MRAHFLKEKIAMSKRKFASFVDTSCCKRSVDDTLKNLEDAAYSMTSKFCSLMCELTAFYAALSEPLRGGDPLDGGHPYSEEIRFAFQRCYRTECLLIREDKSYFTAHTKWFRVNEKNCFQHLRMRVRIVDCKPFVTMLRQ